MDCSNLEAGIYLAHFSNGAIAKLVIKH